MIKCKFYFLRVTRTQTKCIRAADKRPRGGVFGEGGEKERTTGNCWTLSRKRQADVNAHPEDRGTIGERIVLFPGLPPLLCITPTAPTLKKTNHGFNCILNQL